MRDHGGDIDRARAGFGGATADWLDLSTGINPVPYPLPGLTPAAWAALPTRAGRAAMEAAAARTIGTRAPVTSLAGAQAAIQLVPALRPAGIARVLGPTYNEHAATLRAAGWRVEEAGGIEGLSGADLAVVVNPNNPDGRCWTPGVLRSLASEVGLLVIDESFADPHPELSLAPIIDAGDDNVLILRSFGKFYGLAGLRLGFAVGGAELIGRIITAAGPWPVSGPAIEIASVAYADATWREATILSLAQGAKRMDRIAAKADWKVAGGTTLFRLFETPDAAEAQRRLARGRVWSRIFPYSSTWLRLGLPGGEDEWRQLEDALTA